MSKPTITIKVEADSLGAASSVDETRATSTGLQQTLQTQSTDSASIMAADPVGGASISMKEEPQNEVNLQAFSTSDNAHIDTAALSSTV